MNHTMISEEDEAQFLEIGFNERLDPDKERLLLWQFINDIDDHGIVMALTRVTDRLSPREAILFALSALSIAAHGAKTEVSRVGGARPDD